MEALVNLWGLSAVHHGPGQRVPFKQRVRFVLAGLRVVPEVRELLASPASSAFARALGQRPELLAIVRAPYVCAHWNARQRLRHLESHFAVVERRLPVFDFPLDGHLELLDLSELAPGLRVVVDQPRWFTREGPLALNLFSGDVRLYSLCFSFADRGPELEVFIGAIQGRSLEGVLDEYKDLTKQLHGMRPRDFLIELLRMICRACDVQRIWAIADASRQHRSSYYGNKKSEVLKVSYDEIWTDRGGTLVNRDFFALPVHPPERNLEDVPSKKRAMYRRRFDMLQQLEAAVASVVGSAKVRQDEAR